jgi:hypothetical protein
VSAAARSTRRTGAQPRASHDTHRRVQGSARADCAVMAAVCGWDKVQRSGWQCATPVDDERREAGASPERASWRLEPAHGALLHSASGALCTRKQHPRRACCTASAQAPRRQARRAHVMRQAGLGTASARLLDVSSAKAGPLHLAE